jgi:hypothetical protein
MRFALVTTTIQVPEVLRRYRKLGPDVEIIVAGDMKTPPEAVGLIEEVGVYLDLTEQVRLHPTLSATIGWNSIQRRNFALLEAMKLAPDVIVSVDDDNIPMGDYFFVLERAFEPGGMSARGKWFNLGELAFESYTYRGYPRSQSSRAWIGQGNAQRIGVVNGLIYGDPDINATERIERDPQVSGYYLGVDGVTVDPRETWTPINSQNTAWRAELAPLAMVLPHVGRYDDIWASYIAQRVLSATDFHIRFGKPYVRQERNPQSVYRNLRDEIFGMENTDALLVALKEIPIDSGASVLENLRAVLRGLEGSGIDLPFAFFWEWLAACEALTLQPA